MHKSSFKKKMAQRITWLRIPILAVLVLLIWGGTMFAMRLSGMTQAITCELEEHTHTPDCYTQVTVVNHPVLVCSLHSHQPSCYGEDGSLSCGQADFAVHEHTESCYAADSELLCTLPEILVHEHTEECYDPESEALICGLPEVILHTHIEAPETAPCYDAEGNLICEIPEVTEHEHTADCYDATDENLICEIPEMLLHVHIEEPETVPCYDAEGNRICGMLEVTEHSHTELCLAYEEAPVDAEALTCTDPDHDHTALCYGVWELTCGKAEHTHTDLCTGPNSLTPEQLRQVADINDRIAALPTAEEARLELDDLRERYDHEGWMARFSELEAQCRSLTAACAEMTEQQAAITEADKLLALTALCDGETLNCTENHNHLAWCYLSWQEDDSGQAGSLTPSEPEAAQPMANVGSIGDRLNGDYAYISALEIKSVIDGSTPWDENNNPGNDTGPSNGIIRSFDSVSYTVSVRNAVRPGSPATYYREGTLHFEFLIPAAKTQAIFEPNKMTWLEGKPGSTYTITDITYNGKPAQILRGSFLWQPADGNDHAIGESEIELDLYLRVLAMTQGQQFQPLFTFWLEGNQVPAGTVTGSSGACAAHGTDHNTIAPAPLTVSSEPRFNVTLNYAGRTWVDNYNFSKGNSLALNKDAGVVNGRLLNFTIVLQIYGKSAAHGLRGCELPDGQPISFDVDIASTYRYTTAAGTTTVDSFTNGYTPLVWSFGIHNYGTTADGRHSISQILLHAPFGKLFEKVNEACYNSGSWRATLNPDNHTVRMTISDYQVDLNRFPNTTAGASVGEYAYYNPNTITGPWDVQKACFSAGALILVQPFKDAAGQLVSEKFAPGSFTVTLTDRNLCVTGQSVPLPAAAGSNGNQMARNDDSAAVGAALETPGTLDYDIAFHRGDYTTWMWNEPLAEGCWENGKDWAIPGSRANIFDWMIVQSEGNQLPVAIDQFVKFDPDYYIPKYPSGADGGDNVSKHGITYRAAYAAIAPGSLYGTPEGGWDHKGLTPNEPGYDEAMIHATADDMIFFRTLAELERRGYVCVGVLHEGRGLSDTTELHTDLLINGMITPDASLAGNVFMITHSASVWTKADLREAAAAWCGKSTDSLTDSDFIRYSQQKFPSRVGSNEGKLFVYQGNYPAFPNNFNNQGPNGTNTDRSARFLTYEKSVYDTNGWAKGTSGTDYGDSCLLLPYKMRITKSVTQTTDAGQKKTTYSMDDGQRYADFMMVGAAVVATRNITQGTGSNLHTTVTVKDVLPAGLSYVDGSSWYGGTYVQTGEGKRGTYSGGQPITPAVTRKSDGTTELVYTIPNVEIDLLNGTTLPPIYYSCLIGNPNDVAADVANGDKLINTATIWSTEDHTRPFTTINENRITCEINVSKLRQANISKLADQAYVDVGTEMGFTIALGNSGMNARQVVALDLLPYHGFNGTSFAQGTACQAAVTELSLRKNTADVNLSQFSVYYSNNPAVRNNTSDAYRTATEAELLSWGWQKLTVSTDTGTISIPADLKPVAFLILGTLPPQQTLGVHTTLQLTKDTPNDLVINKLYESGDTAPGKPFEAQAATYVVSRALSGLAWSDLNKDGIQNDGASTLLPGVKVELLRLHEGLRFPANQENDPMLFLRTNGILAAQLKRIRVVAAIPQGDIMQLFYGLNTTTLTEENSISLVSDTDAPREYVFELGEKWGPQSADTAVRSLRLDPVKDSRKAAFTLVSIALEFADGSVRMYDYTGAEQYWEQGLIESVRHLPQMGHWEANPELDASYYPYVYPNGTPAVTETDNSGSYRFDRLPAGTYAVRFSSGSGTDLKGMAVSPMDIGSNDTIDSDSDAIYSEEHWLEAAIIRGIWLPAASQMSSTFYESEHNDSGFYFAAYQLPETGGIGTEAFHSLGLALMLTAAAGLVLRKKKR